MALDQSRYIQQSLKCKSLFKDMVDKAREGQWPDASRVHELYRNTLILEELKHIIKTEQ